MHSPSAYQIALCLLDKDKVYYKQDAIEQHREHYLLNKTEIQLMDLGAGSRTTNSKLRTISAIAKEAGSNRDKCRILFNLVNYFKPNQILELGTNLGLGSAYLKIGQPDSVMQTVEGDPTLVSHAKDLFQKLALRNIDILNSNFEDYFNSSNSYTRKVDFAFIDGNHKYDETIKYFDQIYSNGISRQMIVVDDINWSNDMARAWLKIKEKVDSKTVCINNFRLGVIYKDPLITNAKHISLIETKHKPWRLGLN